MDIKDIEFDIDVFTIRCDHCKQESFILPMNSRTLQHGLIFLIGENDGYIGITCPNEDCLRTIIKKETRERIQEIRSYLFAPFECGPGYVKPLLRYHSFPFGYDSEGYEFPSPIHTYSKALNESEKSVIEEEVTDLFLDNPKDVYFSYFFGDLATNPAIYVIWLDEVVIPQLVNFENEKGIKVLPRYTIYDPLLEKAETFCYKHFLEKEFLADLPESLEVHLVPSGPHREAERPYELLEILTTSEAGARSALSPISLEPEKPNNTDDNRKLLRNKAISLFKKGFGRDFLNQIYSQFIQDYIEISGKTDFTCQAFDSLRNDYLRKLHKQMNIEFLGTTQYAFYEESGTWTIIFDGNPIRALKGQGFRYIHHLVSHMRKQINIHDFDKNQGNHNDLVLPDSDNQTIADRQYVADIYKKKNELEREIEEAELQGDIALKEEIYGELEKYSEYLNELFKPGGGLKEFKDETAKVKDKIGRSIDRALKQLTRVNKDAGAHFRDALRPIYSYTLCYNPRENIEWHLD